MKHYVVVVRIYKMIESVGYGRRKKVLACKMDEWQWKGNKVG
jgi:hypothetical protein